MRRMAIALAVLLSWSATVAAQPAADPPQPEPPAQQPPAFDPPPAPPPPPPGYAPQAQPQYPYPYPYPYQYPYQYPPPGMYAPPAPAPPKPRYPDDAAAQSSPFVDVTLGGVSLEHRFQHFLAFGIQAGAYLGGIVRVAPQIAIFSSEPSDELGDHYYYGDDQGIPEGFNAEGAESPVILWGGSLGFAVLSRQSFVLSPGVLVLRTDESAYGTMIGLHVPFEWVTDDGMRIGFTAAFGRAFGGSVSTRCDGSLPAVCSAGEAREVDREDGPAFYAQFQMGWGFNHPEAVLPRN